MAHAVPISTDSEQSYRTPLHIVAAYRKRFNYIIDLAADHTNAVCDYWLDEVTDALSRDWAQEMYRVHNTHMRPHEHCAGWLNPPFAHAGTWAQHMRRNAVKLLPGDTFTMLCLSSSIGTEWFKEVSRYCFTDLITPRFSYDHPDPAAAAADWAAKKPGRTPEQYKPAAPSGSMMLIFTRDSVLNPTPVGAAFRVRFVTIRKGA